MECLLSQLCMLLFLLLLVHPQATDAKAQENIYASGCTGQDVVLECPEHYRIAIKRLFYGVKRAWECQTDVNRKASCCHAAHTDCLVYDDTKYPTLNTHCSGHQRCQIVVQKMPASEACIGTAHTDYMTVIYDCVPEADIATFCSNDVKQGQTLYLSNLEYPSRVAGQKADCSCMVRTTGGEGINIHSIDVLLAWAEHGTRSCSKELVIEDDMNYRWDIQCGHVGFYGFRTIYTRPVHNVTLTLKSSTGNGAAYIWLQTRATETEDKVEIYCGEPLRQLLIRLRQEVESRHRNDDDDRTTPTNRNYGGKNSTFPYAAHVGSLTSNLAAIIGGIVAAGFVLISIVIIAIAFHCRRMQLAKKKASPINLYPAVTNGETTNLTSYCRYDYDDDHYSSINRSPLKMSSLTDTDIATSHARTNGFVTLATAEAHPQSPREHNHVGIREVVQPIQHSPPSARDPLLNDPAYNGHLSLRFSRPAGGVHNADIHDGHKTLPDNRSKILVSGPKSPLGKRSKSVTFSQPVAMVTPLPSGSEESMGEAEENLKGSPTYSLEDGNYDNLNKVFIPDHPLSPTQIHTVPIQRPNNLSGVVHKDVNGSPHHQAYVNSLPRSMSTFRAEDDVDNDAIKDYDEVGPYNLPPPPPHIINGDTYAVVHKPKAVPVYHPQRQNAQLYETGV